MEKPIQIIQFDSEDYEEENFKEEISMPPMQLSSEDQLVADALLQIPLPIDKNSRIKLEEALKETQSHTVIAWLAVEKDHRLAKFELNKRLAKGIVLPLSTLVQIAEPILGTSSLKQGSSDERFYDSIITSLSVSVPQASIDETAKTIAAHLFSQLDANCYLFHHMLRFSPDIDAVIIRITELLGGSDEIRKKMEERKAVALKMRMDS